MGWNEVTCWKLGVGSLDPGWDKHLLKSQKKVGVKCEWVWICITLRYPSFQETKRITIEISIFKGEVGQVNRWFDPATFYFHCFSFQGELLVTV